MPVGIVTTLLMLGIMLVSSVATGPVK